MTVARACTAGAIVFLFSLTTLAQSSAEPASASGLDLSALDKSANPCTDFYQYACGGWMKSHPIPADQARWGSFDLLYERNLKELRNILEDSAKHQDRSPIDAKIGGFYASCMNEPLVEQRGTEPLRAELERIQRIASSTDLLDEVARLHQRDVGAFFDFGPSPDPKNAKMTIANLDQGGLGLPERDFYLRTDAKSQDIRQKYVAHIAKLLELIGTSHEQAAAKAAKIMALETELAKASLDVTTRRDPQKLVHSLSRAELQKLSPDFDFDRYFTEVQSPEFKSLNVAVPDFFKAFSTVVAKADLADLKDYLTWHYVHSNATKLPKAFVDENFNFYGRVLSGTTENRPRWKRCVASTDQALGEALGQKFVEKTFGEQGKQRTLAMVNAIEKQMAIDIDSLTWLGPKTKQAALLKLRAVTNKIGYPDKWRDYSSVAVAPDDYFGNWDRASEFEIRRQHQKIGKPVDRTEWQMTPPTVNAYYDPTQNNINFPAGILQPPFYSNAASDSVNFGAVGVVVGHELTHGFDDEGRQFDAEGNLRDWWTKDDEQQFTKLAQCFVNEYGAFSPLPGVELNGNLTLGENTADNGGARLAYMALMSDLAARSAAAGETKDGFTPPQQFFLGYAQLWCQNMRPEAERLQTQVDPHSPGRFRVNGVVQNMPEFSKAFACKAGDKMQSTHSCRLW